jgi:hypothetical protein
MKIIDHTPFRAENGEISLPNRIQASLKFGMSWYDTVMAQDEVQELLKRHLPNSFTLLRQITLPETGLQVPMILVGPPGVFVIMVTSLRGLFRAKGEEWGSINGNRFVPAKENLLKLSARYAKVVQTYLGKQGFEGMLNAEPILMGANPGLQIESVRPIVRIVLVDAIEHFARSLTQARALLNGDAVEQVILRLQKPRPKEAPVSAQPAAEKQEVDYNSPTYSGTPVTDDDLSAAFQFSDAEPEPQTPAQPAREAAQAGKPEKRKKKKGGFKLTAKQGAILLGEIFLLICILVGFIIYALISAAG